MPPQHKSKEFNPLAVNILRLQRYNFNIFSLEQIIFFEYLVVKAQAFNFKPFFYSNRRISDETGIKKAKLSRIIVDFQNKGIISVEVRGFPLVQWFTVNFDVILRKLDKIYQLPENGQLHSDFGQLLSDYYQLLSETSQQKELIEETDKKNNKKNKEIDSDSATKKILNSKELEQGKKLLDLLDKTYNERRIMKNTATKEMPKTVLPRGKNNIRSAAMCLQYKGEMEVKNAFVAYTDAILSEKFEPAHTLNYFFTLKEDEFDVINNYLEYYNRDYRITKKELNDEDF